ncbi:MAG: response regulator transcription factor [Acetobacteraceae bacterium]|nr:response regulator transcription factor [Acetobacteraceae bacterium]
MDERPASTLPARVLVVEDEADLREAMVEYLAHQGFVVQAAADAAAARTALSDQRADIVLLDLNMPGEDGLSLARWLRSQPAAPGIIMVTAAADLADRVVGLELGADDYLGKPFALRELLARVRALARRLLDARPVRGQTGRRVAMGNNILDLGTRRLATSDGSEIPLTAMEFDLLAAFAERPGRVLSREQLLDLAHDKDSDPFDRSIDVRITRIRRKIEVDPAHPRIIRTVRGAGYVFRPGDGE